MVLWVGGWWKREREPARAGGRSRGTKLGLPLIVWLVSGKMGGEGAFGQGNPSRARLPWRAPAVAPSPSA